MGENTGIQWTDDTVNPSSGCDGCELWIPGKGGPCYAGNFQTNRLSKSLPQLYARDFTEVRMIPGRMAKAAAWSDLTGTERADKPWLNGMPRCIFLSDMSDVLSRAIPFHYLKTEIIDVVTSKAGSRHIWQWLTKRPSRMAEFSASLLKEGIPWPRNLWVGTSVTSKKSVARVDHLLKVGDETTTRFVSAEPLVEEVTFNRWVDGISGDGSLNPMTGYVSGDGCYAPWVDLAHRIHWVIVGGMSGTNPEPFNIEWARSITRECRVSSVACFIKQLGARPQEVVGGRVGGREEPNEPGDVVSFKPLRDTHGGDMAEWPVDLRVREMPKWRPA